MPTSRAGPTDYRLSRPRSEAVERFIAASGRPAEQVIGIIPPRRGRATVEVLAVNAVMAGCRPEFMPVIIAALEGTDG